MVYYSIDDLKPGMVIGQSIYDEHKKLVIASGYRLNRNHIKLLKKWGYSEIQIYVKGTESINPESIISDHVQQQLSQVINKTSKDIEMVFRNTEKTKEKVLKLIKSDSEIIRQYIRTSGSMEVINTTVNSVMQEPWTIANLCKMQETDNSLFKHAIHVTVIALCIGKKYHFDHNEMKQLGLGAINCDIGMLALPEELVNKEEELTTEEKVALQQHAVYGYLMLQGSSEIPPTSATVALSHHEQQDGLGLPRGLKGENRQPVRILTKENLIHRFAEIVAVADTYDMFINGRKHYSKKLSPGETIKKLIEMAGSKLNSEIVKTLVSIVPAYPVGARIKIVNCPNPDLVGGIGVVSKVDPAHLFEPSILIYESRNHQPIKPVKIDISNHKGISIELLN